MVSCSQAKISLTCFHFAFFWYHTVINFLKIYILLASRKLTGAPMWVVMISYLGNVLVQSHLGANLSMLTQKQFPLSSMGFNFEWWCWGLQLQLLIQSFPNFFYWQFCWWATGYGSPSRATTLYLRDSQTGGWRPINQRSTRASPQGRGDKWCDPPNHTDVGERKVFF